MYIVRIHLIPVSNKRQDVLTLALLCKWSQGQEQQRDTRVELGAYHLAADVSLITTLSLPSSKLPYKALDFHFK